MATSLDHCLSWKRVLQICTIYHNKEILGQSTRQSYSRILQLQTGYNILNQYRSKLGQTESNLCQCGQVEDTEHFLLECPIQEEPRNILARNLGQKIGLYHLGMQELLRSSEDENISEYREVVRRELAEFIEAT